MFDMPAAKRRFRGLTLALALCLPSAAAADVVALVVVPPDAPRDRTDLGRYLSDIIAGGPVSILSRDGRRVTLSTTEGGFALLSSADSLDEVHLLGRAGAEPAAYRIVTIRLTTGPAGLADGLAADDARAARVSAALVPARNRADRAAGETAGPGTLLVIGRGADGREIFRAAYPDPRLVRAESADATGKLTGYREFLRHRADLSLSVPDGMGVTLVEILQPKAGGRLSRLASLALR